MKTELVIANQTELKNLDSVDDLASRFFDFLDISPASLKAYRTGVKTFLAFLHSKGISQPTRETILGFKQALTAKYSPATTALYLTAVRRFFDWCSVEGLYNDITRGVKTPKLSHEHKRDAFSAREVRRVITSVDRKTIQGLRDFAMISLIASCGLRTIEVTRANVEDFRRVRGQLVLFLQGKGHVEKDAYVKITEPVEKAITQYLKARGNVRDCEPLFASCSRRNRGGRLTTRTVSSVCKTAMIRAGFDSKRLTAHSLRHSAVTIALENGNSLDDVKEFARHSSIGTTMIYNHSVNRMKSNCESSISKAIFGR